MDTGQEEPRAHEIGHRTYLVAHVEALDVDGVRAVEVGIVAFAVAFAVLVPFRGALAEQDRSWWLWTALAGVGLGLVGREYCRRHRRVRTARQAAARRTAAPPGAAPVSSAPPTRWARGGGENEGFGARFAALLESGDDLEGEARLADALCPRAARVLDVGSGMGRVGAALRRRGHDVLAVEPQADLVAQSRATYPDLPVVHRDVLDLDDAVLAAHGYEGGVDLVVAVGNVMIFLAEGTEVAVLRRLAAVLAPGGRVLVGFHPLGGPTTSRDYPPEEFVEDVTAAGLTVHARFGSYELHPPAPDYAVWVLGAAQHRPPADGGDRPG